MYLYHANAVALGGTFVRPFQQTIPSQAACSIPSAGGTASSRAEKFNFNGVISFEAAQSDLAAGVEQKNGKTAHVTRVSVVVEGLNILNMFTADRIVARLASEHSPQPPQSNSASGGSNPASTSSTSSSQAGGASQSGNGGNQTATPLDEPSIITTGCHFDNLRIAGHPVKVEVAHNVFSELHTYGECEKCWKKSKATLQDTLMGKTIPQRPAVPGHLQDIYDGYQRQINLPNLRETVLSSFVKSVSGIDEITGSEIQNWGPIIVIPQFGTIYLGEVIISPGYRRVNMFRLELGSPDGGSVVGPGGDSNGGGYP